MSMPLQLATTRVPPYASSTLFPDEQPPPGRQVRGPSEYLYMTVLARKFKTPRTLLRCFTLSLERRAYLLRKWRDERARYLFEHGRDLDYTQDAEMQNLLLVINDMKANPRRFA